MIKCILIDKKNINEINIKNLSDEDLYKRCNFKNNINFNKIKTWSILNNCNIELWGKTEGLNNYKNLNNFLVRENINVYGKCIFILKNNLNNLISLNLDDFNKFYKLNENNEENGENGENEENEENVENEENEENEENGENGENEEYIIKKLDYYINNELEYEIYNYNDEI